MTEPIYNQIGVNYSKYRRADPRLVEVIADLLLHRQLCLCFGGTRSFRQRHRTRRRDATAEQLTSKCIMEQGICGKNSARRRIG